MKHEITGFEHCHLHTHLSLLDGFGLPEEYAQRAKKINQQYLCVTDHGSMAAVPSQIRECENSGISPIFGNELYVNPLQRQFDSVEDKATYLASLSDEDRKDFNSAAHLLAIAYNETGYKNLVRLTSWAWLNGKHKNRPRVNHEQLKLHREGIVFTTCCYNSEVGKAYDRYGEEVAEKKLLELKDIFGENYYLEIMMLDFHKQPGYDQFIIKMHDKYNMPIILTQDCHYSIPEHSHNQRLMLMVQTGRTIQEIEEAKKADETKDFFELQDANLWMKSEEELNEMWEKKYQNVIDYEIFKIAKKTTIELCRKAEGVKLDRSLKLPQLPDANATLKEEVEKGFKRRNLPDRSVYHNRIKREYDLICKKGFSSYFLIQKMMTDEARRICPILLGWGDGWEATGPGRGSQCSSLISYCLGLHNIDPIKHDLLFERFLSEARGGKTMKFRFTDHPLKAMADMEDKNE